jgi:integrase
MKNGDAHTMPLPQIVLDILEDLPRYEDGPFVFSTTAGKKPISGYSKMKSGIDKAVEMEPWGFHDLRRTMATQMAKIGIQQHVVEKLLDHRSGKISGIAAVYNKHEYREEMKSAVDAWARRLREIVESAAKKETVTARA